MILFFILGRTVKAEPLKRLFKEKRRRLRKWDYLGNSIVNPLVQSATSDEFSLIDKYEIVAFPELITEDNNLTIQEKYKNFYFTKSHVSVDTILNKTKGIILLHNSWTPKKYKNMTESEFLSQDIFLVDLLKKVLEKK